MRSWHGVVTKIAKQGKGAVVKNRLGPEVNRPGFCGGSHS